MGKALFTSLTLWISLFYTSAQPAMVQYSENLAFFNPAAVAFRSSDSFRITSFYRNQWVKLNGNPVELGATVEYNLSKINSGVGLNFHRDRIGLIKAFDFGLAYRYSIKFKNDRALSAGLSVNYYHMRVKGLFIGPQTSFYENSSAAKITSRFGLLYSSRSLVLGISVFHPTQPVLRFKSLLSTFNLTRTFNFHSAYKFRMNQNQTITPELVLLATSSAYFTLLNVNWDFKKKTMVGSGVKILPGIKTSYAGNIRFGYNLFNQWYLGAAYECFFKYWDYNPHTIEFILRYQFNKKANTKNQSC
jgi:type IX secretion system PorP/SprF family membrane protein